MNLLAKITHTTDRRPDDLIDVREDEIAALRRTLAHYRTLLRIADGRACARASDPKTFAFAVATPVAVPAEPGGAARTPGVARRI